VTEQPTDVLRRIDDALDESLERLFALLRIPSVSTDPAYAQPCRNAADWLQRDLSSMGFEASTRPTQGHPMVVAHWREEGAGDAPHVLFYGHYDVQPADPLELWDTPPFEPRIAESPNGQVIVARGACDDKGQLMTFVEACRAWIAETGGLPVNVTVLLEGEEESGSKSIGPFLEENREELAADLALVCDTGMWDRDTPAITTMLRGLVYEEVTITAADRDLHSGLFGGAARNPIQVLARILASLHDETGHVTIPGFYDGVQELPEAVRQQWTELGFDAIGFLSQVGLAVPAGETERSVVEQIWSRPTCEFNGIVGGYIGEGAKTVIPSKASAKVSFRLVGEQDPRAVSDAFRDFVRARLPSDCTAEFSSHGMSPALQLPFDSPYLDRARDALQAEFGRPAALIGSGGSIPIVGEFKRMLGMDTLLIGFGLDDDRVHSPNEKYDLESFRRGARSWARVLGALASG
jgi:acetylornithine deacetylase/succinyl-diaminopimelate desuccinylase-like protein